MIAEISSSAVIGLDAMPVKVEVDILQGLPAFNIVGLPDKAVEESKERVRSAIKNSDAHFPNKRLTVNLSPADIKKEGPLYDLPVAIGILASAGQIGKPKEDEFFVGELSLSGDLRHIKGVLPIMLMARSRGIKRIYLPRLNASEASLVSGVEIIPVDALEQLLMHLKGEKEIGSFKHKDISRVILKKEKSVSDFDMKFIAGQEQAKRTLEIAAAGGHNVLMIGPPGAGKTMLSRSFSTILPRMQEAEVLETTKIFSVAGILSHDSSVVTDRPFRSPHHTASNIALVGGGQWPRPGEISLAHRGVLFLDELPEFNRNVLEALRQPLEDGIVSISRAQGQVTFPARFILVAAMNPCPCGNLGNQQKDCVCTPSQITRYQKKISGPILDRIDIHIEVPQVKYEKLTSEDFAESSKKIRKRVEKARQIQIERFKDIGMSVNAEMSARKIKVYCNLDEKGAALLKTAVAQMGLSARGYHRVLKLSRTIADLSGVKNIKPEHVAEAIQYRPKEAPVYA